MTGKQDNSSFELIRLFNNLKKALDAQASNDAKIEPVVLPPPNPLPLPIPPLDEKRIDTNKKSSKHWDER